MVCFCGLCLTDLEYSFFLLVFTGNQVFTENRVGLVDHKKAANLKGDLQERYALT